MHSREGSFRDSDTGDDDLSFASSKETDAEIKDTRLRKFDMKNEIVSLQKGFELFTKSTDEKASLLES